MPRSQRGLRGIGAMVKLHRIHAVRSSIPHWDSNHTASPTGELLQMGGYPLLHHPVPVVMDDPSWTRWPAPGTTFFQLQLWVPCRCSTRPWNEPQLISTLTLLKKATKICGLKDNQTKKIHELNMIQWVVDQVTVVGFTEKKKGCESSESARELGDSSANVWISPSKNGDKLRSIPAVELDGTGLLVFPKSKAIDWQTGMAIPFSAMNNEPHEWNHQRLLSLIHWDYFKRCHAKIYRKAWWNVHQMWGFTEDNT